MNECQTVRLAPCVALLAIAGWGAPSTSSSAAAAASPSPLSSSSACCCCCCWWWPLTCSPFASARGRQLQQPSCLPWRPFSLPSSQLFLRPSADAGGTLPLVTGSTSTSAAAAAVVPLPAASTSSCPSSFCPSFPLRSVLLLLLLLLLDGCCCCRSWASLPARLRICN